MSHEPFDIVSMELIGYVSRFHVVVCKKCHMGVLMNSQFDTHFKRQHQVGGITRKAMRKRIMEQYPQAIQDEQSLMKRFQYPTRQAPLPEIPTQDHGLACDMIRHIGGPSCEYVCHDVRGMQRHCHQEHGWINPQPSGGSITQRCATPRPWREEVRCQRLFHHGPRNGYWEVIPDKGTPTEAVRAVGSQPEFAEQMLAQIREKEATIRARDNHVQPGTKLDAHQWLERTEWPSHLQGFRWKTLIGWAALPQEGEEPLRRMCKSLDRVIDIAQEAIVDSHCPFFSRFDINKKEIQQNMRRPFQARMEADTKKRYCQVLHRIMGYIYRTKDLAHRPTYELTPPQECAWRDFVVQVEQAGDEAEDEEGEEEPDHDIDVEEETGNPDTVPIQPTKQLTAMRPVDRACLEVWMQLFNHRLESRHYQSVVLSALAAIGVDSEEETWCSAMNYTPTLSAVIKLARMMVALRGVDQGEMGAVERIRRMVNRFMVEDQPVPMKWLFSTRRFGLKIRSTTTAEGSIRWEGDTVSYQNVKFDMEQLRTWVRGLKNECSRIMEEELLMMKDEEGGQGDQPPAIPWEKMSDNPSETRPGYHFMTHNAAQMPVDGATWLFHRIVGDAGRASEFVHETGAWRDARVTRYMRAIRRFKEKLLMLMHISGGQPARAPELLSVRYCNTHTGGRRNIFIERGQVVFVTAYHKGYAFEGSSKIIHRYLPREVGELLVQYMWLVRPFEQQLEVSQYDRLSSHGFLWRSGVEDPHWTSERVRKLIQEESMIGMGVKLNISSYRQIAIAITRKYLKGEGFMDDREDENIDDQDEIDQDGIAIGPARDSVFDKQSGHGTHVAGMIYARAILEAPGAVASVREQYHFASSAWHRLLHFESALRSGKRRRGPDEEAEDVQFTRWKRVRRMDMQVQLETMMGPQARFRGVQEASIRAIVGGHGPIVTVMGTGGGKSLLFMLPAALAANVRGVGTPGLTVVVIPMISLRQDLRRRCDQLGIKCAEWNSRRPQGSVSIMLVTPESAISKAFQRYLMTMQASHQLERVVIDECHVVLDSRGDFRPKLQRLSELLVAETQLVMLTATLPPREEDVLFQRMRVPRNAVTMFRAPTSRPNVRYSVVARVRRDEVRGRGAVQPDEEDEEDDKEQADRQIREIVEAKLQQFSQGKIIVYGHSIKRVQRVAAQLGCEAYFRDVHDKAGVFARVVSAACRVVVATNALGLGIDMPDIRAVIHMDGLKKLRDFAQESGRAGRDGGMSESIVVAGGVGGRNVDEEERDRIERYQADTICSRVVLDAYLDGRTDRVGCEDGEEPCWVCRSPVAADGSSDDGENDGEQPRQDDGCGYGNEGHRQGVGHDTNPEQEEFHRIRRQRQMMREQMQWMRSDEAIEVEEFRRRVEEWSHQCQYCYMRGDEERARGHRLEDCAAEGVTEVQEEYDRLQSRIRWQDYAVCWSCAVPMAICRRFEPNGFGRWRFVRGQSCQFPGTMIATFASVMFPGSPHEAIRDSVMAWMWEDGVDVSEAPAVYAWLGTKIQWGEMEAARMNRVFLRLVQSVG